MLLQAKFLQKLGMQFSVSINPIILGPQVFTPIILIAIKQNLHYCSL